MRECVVNYKRQTLFHILSLLQLTMVLMEKGVMNEANYSHFRLSRIERNFYNLPENFFIPTTTIPITTLTSASTIPSTISTTTSESTSIPSLSEIKKGKLTSMHARNATARRLANKHIMEMRKYRCHKPRPAVIRVKDVYDSSDRNYLPRCTLLHRCDDQSGCCNNELLTCAPSKTENVELHFLVIYLDNTRRVQSLLFENHTECGCRAINDRRGHGLALTMNRGRSLPSIPSRVHLEEPEFRSRGERIGKEDDVNMILDEKKDDVCHRAKCPHPFRPRPITWHPPHKCICDCKKSRHHRKCRAIKDGRKRLTDRCVISGTCMEPFCKYQGTFDKFKGQCPEKGPKHRIRHPRRHWAHQRD